MKKSQTMKKLVMLYVALLALAATTACRSGKRIALSDNPICTTSFVKAEIQYRTDSASNVEWGESEPFDCQPLVDYLCRCRARKEPMKFLPYVVVRLYDNNHNEYWLGFSASGRALKIEGRTFRMSKRDAIEIEKLLAAANVAERYGTLKGRVVESGTKRPYMAANVMLKQNGRLVDGATTDEDGCYTIKHIPFGDYTIEVHAIGCQPLEQDVTIGYPTFAIRHFVVDFDSSRITCALPVIIDIGTSDKDTSGGAMNISTSNDNDSYPYRITMIAAPLDIMTVVDIPPEAFDRGWHYCDTVVISNPDTIRRIVDGMIGGATPNKNGGIDTRGKLILKYHDREDMTVYYDRLYMMLGGRYYYADKDVTGWLNELMEQARKQK